jgi:hypothetical protein
MVSQDERRVEIHRRRGDIGWEKIEHSGDETVELKSVGLAVAMREVYEGRVHSDALRRVAPLAARLRLELQSVPRFLDSRRGLVQPAREVVALLRLQLPLHFLVKRQSVLRYELLRRRLHHACCMQPPGMKPMVSAGLASRERLQCRVPTTSRPSG